MSKSARTAFLTALVFGALLSATASVAAGAGRENGSLGAPVDVVAQEAADNKDNNKGDGGLLDDIGLGSLAEIPWGAFAIGAIVSALVGAAGGFIYAGIAGPKEKKGP